MGKIKSVTFFGYSWLDKSDPLWKEVFKIAKRIAQKNYRVVDGGGPGVMLAATQGAESIEKSETTAVYYRPGASTMFEGAAPNNLADQKVYFSDYVQRTMKLLELGDIYFVFKGGTGTISEFAMAWGLARLYYGHHKPLILYGDYWHEIMDAFINNMNIREEEKKVYRIASNVDEAIKIFDEYVEEIENRESYMATLDEAKYIV